MYPSNIEINSNKVFFIAYNFFYTSKFHTNDYTILVDGLTLVIAKKIIQ